MFKGISNFFRELFGTPNKPVLDVVPDKIEPPIVQLGPEKVETPKVEPVVSPVVKTEEVKPPVVAETSKPVKESKAKKEPKVKKEPKAKKEATPKAEKKPKKSKKAAA